MTVSNKSLQLGEGSTTTSSTDWSELSAIHDHPEIVTASFNPNYQDGLSEVQLEMADCFVQSRRHLAKALEGDASTIWDANAYGTELVRGIASLCAGRFLECSSYGQPDTAAIIRRVSAEGDAEYRRWRDQFAVDIVVRHRDDVYTVRAGNFNSDVGAAVLRLDKQGFVAYQAKGRTMAVGSELSADKLPQAMQAWTERLKGAVDGYDERLNFEARRVVLGNLIPTGARVGYGWTRPDPLEGNF